ncbi:hypothetical protein HYY71_00725 [Candidatus Woesearchaeota archaeon]|nr:hypothetical protein [Candidatus Woesearchaeota archaeon]
MAKMRIKKKGVFFTLIAIAIMALSIIIFTPQADISLQKDSQAIRARISSIDNYVDDLENNYFKTVLRATTHKTLLSLIFYINSTGSYIDLDSAFYEVALNGTINQVPIDSTTGKKLMENSTLANWSQKIADAAKDTLNVNTTITIKNASVSQTKPWQIDSRIAANITVKSNVAEWSRISTATASIGIEDFYDPYYLVNTDGAYANQIRISTLEFGKWNVSHVREHLRNGTYMHWENSNAPNFLMRFTNNLQPSACCGIESFVDPNKISAPDQIRSYVDYMLWGGNPQCADLFNITNPQTGGGVWDEFRFFKLDINHTLKYNITSNDAIRTC